MSQNGNINCGESLIIADDNGIHCKTSIKENASARFCIGEFSNNVSAEVDFLLLSFPLPIQGRIEAGLKIESAGNKFSVGRWRDKHVNAYWAWNGVTNLLYSTTHSEGKLRLSKIDGKVYCDYFDMEWVNIADFNVDEEPVRLSLEASNGNSCKEVNVLFSNLNVKTYGFFRQPCKKVFYESFKANLFELKKGSIDLGIKSSPYFGSMFLYLENAIDNYQIFKNQVDNYIGRASGKEILEVGGGYDFPHGGLNTLMLLLEGAKSAIGIDISLPDRSPLKMEERRRFWDFFFEILKHTDQKYYECSPDLVNPIKELTSELNSRLRFSKMNAEKMTFRDDVFDLIISNAVLEHVENPDRFVKEICRVLKPNGLALITWNPFTSLSMGGHSIGIPYYYPWAHLRLPEREHINKLKECYSDKTRYQTAFPNNQVPRDDLAAEYAKEPGKYRAAMLANLNKLRAPEFLRIVSETGFENIYMEYIIEEKHRGYLTEEIKKELHLFSEEELLMTGMISVLRKTGETHFANMIKKIPLYRHNDIIYKDWDLEILNEGDVRFKRRKILCNTSPNLLSIAGVRYRSLFPKDFDICTSYNLRDFYAPSSDRVEINLEVSIGEARYSVGRWRDAQGVNAYFMWSGEAPNNFIPTHNKKGRIRCRRVGKLLFGEFWDRNKWVTIGQRDVTSQEARISLKAFNGNSKRKVSVIFSGIDISLKEGVSPPEKDCVLILFDPQVPSGKGLEIIEERFPNTYVSIICDPSDPIYPVLKDRAKEIYEYHHGMSLISKWRLLKRLRQREFLSCIYIGNAYDLLKLSLIRFCRGGKKIFFAIQKDLRPIEKEINIFDLLTRSFARLSIWIASCPLIFLLYLLLRLEGLQQKPIGHSHRKVDREAEGPINGKRPVSIVIPNYNGKELLSECLPTILKAAEYYHPLSEVIIVDDVSQDGSVLFLQNQFPQVRVISLDRNQGFAKACNVGIEKSANRVVILLNSDIAAEGNFIANLARHFKDPSVFAIQPKMFFWDRTRFNAGMNMGRMEKGYIRIWNEAETKNEGKVEIASPNLYAIGGAMAVDKDKWTVLGGFDALYYPFCWEDIDISYRAWKRGWKVLYEPQSVLFHKHHGTLSMVFKPEFRRIIEQKNEMVFIWKNIHDSSLIREHIKFIPLKLLSNLVMEDYTFVRAFFRAFYQVPRILKRRREGRNLSYVKDKRVLEHPLHLYRNFMRRGFQHRINSRKQILIMNPVLPYPPVDGGKNRVLTLIKFLSKKYDIHLLTFIEKVEENEYISKLKEYCAEVDTVLRNWTPLPRFSEFLFPTHCRGFYSEEMKKKLLDILKTRPIDLVQIEFTLMAYYVNFIRHIPTVFTEHDISVLSPTKSYNPSQNGWKKFHDYFNCLKSIRWEIIHGNQFDKIITVTDTDKRVLARLLPRADIETISTGTDIDFYSEEYQEVDGKSIVFVGFMGHYPNLDAMIYFLKAIYPIIKLEEPETSLTIIGKGGEARLSSIVKDPSIRITGYVEDMRPLLREAAIFVAPMRIGAGIKGKLLEAIAMHKPIVTTSIGCRGLQLIAEQDILVADSPVDFAQKVVSLLRSPRLRETLSKNAYGIIKEHFDWRKISEKLHSIYQDLIYPEVS